MSTTPTAATYQRRDSDAQFMPGWFEVLSPDKTRVDALTRTEAPAKILTGLPVIVAAMRRAAEALAKHGAPPPEACGEDWEADWHDPAKWKDSATHDAYFGLLDAILALTVPGAPRG